MRLLMYFITDACVTLLWYCFPYPRLDHFVVSVSDARTDGRGDAVLFIFFS